MSVHKQQQQQQPRPAALPRQFAAFVNTTNGLDLTLRLIQALGLVAVHVLTDHVIVEKGWIAVAQLALARRYLRFFSFLDCFHRAQKLLGLEDPAQGRSILRTMEIVEASCLGIYILLEDLTMLHDMNIWLVPWYADVLVEANKIWSYAIVLSICRNVWAVYSAGQKGQVDQDQSPAGPKVDEAHGAGIPSLAAAPSAALIWVNIIVDCCDFSLPASALQWVPLTGFGVGVCMTVSSVLAWPQVWMQAQHSIAE